MSKELEGGIVPHLIVAGGKAACDFYAKAFGAETLFQHEAEDGERLMHASLNINGATVMLHDHFEEFGDAGGMKPPSSTNLPSVTIHIEVDDADKWWGRAVEAGCETIFPLDNQFWGTRYGKLRDPFGHIWSIGGPVTE
jgi:PhnB protein